MAYRARRVEVRGGCRRRTATLLFGRIAEPRVPDRRPDETRDAEHVERHPPAVAHLDRHHQQRRDGAAHLAGHQVHAGHRRALARREPSRHHDRRIGKRPGFARPEQEPGKQQAVVARHRPCQGGERRPPQHDAREDAPRADAIAHHAGRNLEEAVGEGEHAGHPSPSDRVDPQFFLHPRSRHRDADAIEIGDREQQHEQADDAAALPRYMRHDGRWCGGLRVVAPVHEAAAVAATVFSTSRRNASIVASRSASGVSSSLQ